MLRAVFCLNGPDAVNGPNVWLTRHLPLLATCGIEPVVLYLSWKPEQPCRFRKALEAAGIAVRAVALGRIIEDNVAAIVAATRALEPDIFAPNYSVAGYYAARFLREAGVQTVGTLHSDDPYYHDILDVFASGEPQWRLSALVGVSDYLCTLANERTGGGLPILQAPYGTPLPEQSATWRPDRFRLLYSGRLVEKQKRVIRVAEALLAATRSDSRIEGVLYGAGPERDRIETLLAGQERVQLGGLLELDAVPKALAGGQAFVLLSDFEGLSIALLEAMAAGLPPIVTAMRSGVSDLVRNGVNGFIVPPDDPGMVAAIASLLAGDRSRWEQVSFAAKRSIEEQGLTSVACAGRWAKFLKDLTAGIGPRRPVEVPEPDELELPPQSTRPDGIRLEDRRPLRRMRAALQAGRPVYLWGASLAGEQFLDAIVPRGMRTAGFIDSDPRKHGQRFRGYRILSPGDLAESTTGELRPFVVITSQYESEIGAVLTSMGFVEDVDFTAG